MNCRIPKNQKELDELQTKTNPFGANASNSEFHDISKCPDRLADCKITAVIVVVDDDYVNQINKLNGRSQTIWLNMDQFKGKNEVIARWVCASKIAANEAFRLLNGVLFGEGIHLPEDEEFYEYAHEWLFDCVHCTGFTTPSCVCDIVKETKRQKINGWDE